jgi:hypothetical protein
MYVSHSSRKRIPSVVAWLAIARSPAARRRLRFPSPKSQCQRAPLEKAAQRAIFPCPPTRSRARRVRAETVSGPGGKARFLCAPLKPVNDLFAQNSLFSVDEKTSEKSARFRRAQPASHSAQTFEDRNDATLTIRLRGFKPSASVFAGAGEPMWPLLRRFQGGI